MEPEEVIELERQWFAEHGRDVVLCHVRRRDGRIVSWGWANAKCEILPDGVFYPIEAWPGTTDGT